MITNNVRTCVGIPTRANFGGSDGTPIVIDVTTGIGYYSYQGRILPMTAGVQPIYAAFSSGFSDGFVNGT
jgi:hypothetical protein